ncbi:MAG: hypothetical protein Q8O99_00275 [bacterium]|nr:hypothetical protein [bacterium]
MDGDHKLDIITNDINGDIKVFYGGGGSDGANYLSNEKFVCDPGWKERQQQQLVKSFKITLGGIISDSSLRHRP